MEDSGYRNAAVGARYVVEPVCSNCQGQFFQDLDKKGTELGSSVFCPACIEEYGLDVCDRCGNEQLGEMACVTLATPI